MAKRIKYQTVNISVGSGVNVNTIVTAKDFLNSTYSKCTAVAVVRAGGSDNISLGIRNQSDQIIDLVHSKLLEVQQDTPVQGRFIPVMMEAGGKEVTIQAQPLFSNTAGVNTFSVIFKLEE